jgi:penicillin-binding protein 1C
MLPLQTTGGEGRRWWFLNGEPQMPPAPATLPLDRPTVISWW